MSQGRPVIKKLKWVVLVLVAIFILIQFYRPSIENPPVKADLVAEPEAKAIIKRACYDCHSNETSLAWFDRVAPAYWLVAKDVKDARRVLNFSNFDSLPKAQQAAKWFESIMQIEQHGMPLSDYTMLHSRGVVTPAEVEILKKYALTLAYKAKPDTVKEHAAIDQYAVWMKMLPGVAKPAPEHNGVGYAELAGFRDWKAVSTTERYDNGTLRLILGNDIAIRAIRKGHTNPWPDGAVFAKIALDQLPDSSGLIKAGYFRQVEFMIKDEEKYKSTFGWGWARWVAGLAMKPYGKDAGFAEECLNCHRPLKENNYTFTLPLTDTLHLFDLAAVSTDNTVAQPMMGRVITCMVDRKKGTQSVLFGNDQAVDDARHGQEYREGDVVTLVTWSQREDPHWFGGRIPKELSQVEVVSFGAKAAYESYEGMPLRRVASDTEKSGQRRQFIAGLRAAVLP